MKKQYWYCIHAKEDQTQIEEEDGNLREFLNRHQVSRPRALMEHAAKGYMSHQGKEAALFCSLKYNKFTNLPNIEEYRFGLYGVKGEHELKRKTCYTNFYLSEEDALLGTGFFDYVFGSVYLSEKEARTDSVRPMLERDAQEENGDVRHVNLQMIEKDRMLACKIAERLWASQLENNGSRMVICISDGQIQSRSMELLKQVYLLLPQRLRLNMGFATSSTFQDIKTLTEDCDLPIHIFTMKTEHRKEWEENREKISLKYPIVFFDADHFEEEACNQKRLELLLKLSRKISPSTEAKLSYAEKLVLEEKRGTPVSFKNLDSALEKFSKEAFCWWEKEGLETIEEIFQLYTDQKEMMKVGILRQEAIHAFYSKMLPWKEYAKQIGEVLLDENYPNRQALLAFFANELQFTKVIEAMEEIRRTVEEKGIEHEKQVVKAQEQRQKEELLLQKQQYELQLAEAGAAVEKLKEDSLQKEKEYETSLKEQKSSFLKQLQTTEEEYQEQLKREFEEYRKKQQQEEAFYQKKLEKVTKEKQAEIKRWKEEAEKLKNTNVNTKLGIGKEKMEEPEQDNQALKKRMIIMEIVLGSAAAVFLVLSIVFGIKAISGNKVKEEKAALESEQLILESEKAELESLLMQKSSRLDQEAANQTKEKENLEASEMTETDPVVPELEIQGYQGQ